MSIAALPANGDWHGSSRTRAFSLPRKGNQRGVDRSGQQSYVIRRPHAKEQSASHHPPPLKRSSSLRSIKKFVSKVARPQRQTYNVHDSGTHDSRYGRRQGQGYAELSSQGSLSNYDAASMAEESRKHSYDSCLITAKAAANVTTREPGIPTSPAVCGIFNHGSTCYLTTVVQCLSNTDAFAEYIVSGAIKYDLNPSSLKSRKFGTEGEVTVLLCDLIRSLWLARYQKLVSEDFKGAIEAWSRGGFKPGYQHDAQEFLVWLLDKVHEDLNKGSSKKRILPVKNRPEDSEDEIASRIWNRHVDQHSSFIQKHFQALFRSTVTCPLCSHVSPTFDPFTCVSLSVPQKSTKPLFVVMVYNNRHPRLLKLGLNAEMAATFAEVKECLAQEAKVELGDLILCTLTEEGFGETLRDAKTVGYLGPNEAVVYAVEAPGAGTPGLGPSRGSGFGSPVCINASREVSFNELWRIIIESMKTQLKYGVNPSDVTEPTLRLRLNDGYVDDPYMNSNVPLPLYTEALDCALAVYKSGFGPSHVKVVLEWKPNAKEKFFVPVPEEVFDHISSYDLQAEIEAPPPRASLADCLAGFITPERMDSDDWKCPNAHCRRSAGYVRKKIMFKTLPDVMIVHLKRFKQAECGEHIKLDSIIDFPVSDLDMTNYVKDSHGSGTHRKTKNGIWTKKPGKQRGGELYLDLDDPVLNVYDLYAVCNHKGTSVHSGHYTAFCRNPVDGNWYLFDDEKVLRVSESELVTKDAYILFYERRAMTKSSSCRSSAESGFHDHWIFKLDRNGNPYQDDAGASFVRGNRSYASVSNGPSQRSHGHRSVVLRPPVPPHGSSQSSQPTQPSSTVLPSGHGQRRTDGQTSSQTTHVSSAVLRSGHGQQSRTDAQTHGQVQGHSNTTRPSSTVLSSGHAQQRPPDSQTDGHAFSASQSLDALHLSEERIPSRVVAPFASSKYTQRIATASLQETDL